ncbi:MAG: FRG domain-containing protein [bacterium]|nr:FRG domain-containing protein [bacterium]
MREIRTKVWSFGASSVTCEYLDQATILKGAGYAVESYQDLVCRVAEIAFKNPEHMLLFRGQHRDHLSGGKRSTLYPKIFRSEQSRLMSDAIQTRFDRLGIAEDFLANQYGFDGARRLRVDQIFRWAILQHYEICATPLLDVTASLRVAASFSMLDAESGGFVYVLGLPQISGSVTVAAEQGLQVIRLLSMCPPQARRPHYQDGYLLGEYPTLNRKGKQEYERREVDFARRVLGKFRLPGRDRFWSDAFPILHKDALLPDAQDEMYDFAETLRRELERDGPGHVRL